MNITENITNIITQYGMKVLFAIIILIVGLWLIKRVVRLTTTVLKKQSIEPGLQSFITSLVSIGLKVLLVIVLLGQLGIQTTSFVAILGAAGLAVGLALQGSLANFAGGALILFFKPFKVGDLIEAQGFLGTVKHIQIFVTTIITPENKTVIIPNGELSNGSITNYTLEGKLRVDLTVGISYDADIKKAKDIVLQVLKKNTHVLETSAPTVNVSELADSSVNLAIRPWVKPEHYWDVYFGVLEDIKLAFDEQGIGIPYPHQVVHMYQKN